ncbi:hypothetical protein EPI10_030334 [Gossypium australe]|uniref:Uncharacterized protein n=1 Tax=Gossypium australe TaxID=47621 RepID=A0A5B6WY79_9ROSI|nr:hypothetical protein EPI10_030334 [Gossypium australe]
MEASRGFKLSSKPISKHQQLRLKIKLWRLPPLQQLLDLLCNVGYGMMKKKKAVKAAVVV